MKSLAPVMLVLFVVGVLLSGPFLSSAQVSPGAERYRIAYATFIGGPEGLDYEEMREAIPYPDGSVLIGGLVQSDGMPVSEGAFQEHYAGDDPRLGHPGLFGGDLYIGRLSPDGSRMLCATYFGGSKQDRNTYGLALDKAGNIVLTGGSRSPDLPTTPGCYQAKGPGFLVAKISADCTRLIWCTYLGTPGASQSPRGGLALDDDDNVLLVGSSNSPTYPTTPGVVQPQLRGPRDSVITKLKADGSGLVFSTFLGGTGEDDAIMGARLDPEGNIYVAGHTKSGDFPVTPGCAQARAGGQSDCYIAKLSRNADRILYATYLGGSGEEFAEHRPWLDPDGTFLVTGYSGSADFPATAGALQRSLRGRGAGFVTRVSADGTSFAFATLLAGNLLMPTPDGDGNVWVVGSTSERDLPVTPDALQKTFGGGQSDGVLAALTPDGSRLVYCTYLGGKGDDIIRSLAWGADGALYLVGGTSSPDFPVTPGALQTRFGGGSDAFVVKLAPA